MDTPRTATDDVARLTAQATEGQLSRRAFVKRTTALGIAAPALGAAMATRGGRPSSVSAANQTAPNPRPTITSDSVTIEVVGFYAEGSAEYANFEWINQEFAKTFPNVDVEIVITSADALRLRLEQGDPPEVGAVAGSFTNVEDSAEMIEAGWIHNLQEAMQQESWDTPGKSWWDTIHPIVQPLLQVPNHPGVWSFPREVTTLVFFYNTKLFEQAAVTPPTTWSEFTAVCDALKAQDITPITIDGTVSHGYMEWYFSELSQKLAGRQALREAIQGQRRFTEEPFLRAATLIREMVDKDYFVDGFSGLDHTGSQMIFYQGQAAMVLVGSWLVGEMRNAIPTDFGQDVFRFPMVEGGQGEPFHIYGTSNLLGIATESGNPLVGVEWARHFNSVKVNNKRTEDLQYQSAILGTQPPTWMPSLNRIWDESVQLDIFGMGDLWSSMADARTRYIESVGKLFFKEVSPEEFVEQVDKIVGEFWEDRR